VETVQTIDEHFVEYVRANRVFVLGAGFSAAAGLPLTSTLLVNAMGIFQRECPGIWERVNNYAATAFGIEAGSLDYSCVSFSQLCTFLEYVELSECGGGERWSDSGSREKLALKFYLARALVSATPQPNEMPELYLAFARQLQPRDVILSFNWDGLLENALSALGKTYSYHFKGEGIKLYKLHGSVNWRLREPRDLNGPVANSRLGWKALGLSGGPILHDVYYSNALLHREAWSNRLPLGEVEPFLVLPGYGKAFDVRHLSPFWYKPDFVFEATHDVYIIGLSVAEDDFFIRSFFLDNLPYIDSFTGVSGRRIHIVNPDPRAAEAYEFVLKKGSATIIAEPFAVSHVEEMCQDTGA